MSEPPTNVNMHLVRRLPEYQAAVARGDARRTLKAMSTEEEQRTMAFLYHYGLTFAQLAKAFDLSLTSIEEKMRRWSKMVEPNPVTKAQLREYERRASFNLQAGETATFTTSHDLLD